MIASLLHDNTLYKSTFIIIIIDLVLPYSCRFVWYIAGVILAYKPVRKTVRTIEMKLKQNSFKTV